jgi:two-component system phosphate regulon sensor histidine kinase PhoR
MTAQGRKIILATIAVVSFFAAYETVKTLIFPRMGVVASHIISTIVVGITTVFIARYVFSQQMHLLDERQQANQRLQEALVNSGRDQNLLRSIVASVAEGLLITDRDSNVLIINDAARKLLDVGDRQAPRLTDINRDPQLHKAFLSALTTGESAEARIETRSGANDRRVLRLHAAPLRLAGSQVDGVVCALIDVTELERLERVRQEFLSNVSHELRTPLAAITAYTETLLDGGIDDAENSLRFLQTIQRNAERMKALVNDISELSAIESGAAQLTVESLPLHQLVNDVFAGLAPRAAKHGVMLQNKIAEAIEVNADRCRLEQILINLVDNAIKFNRPGGNVMVTVQEDQAHQIIKVRDTGPGIPAEHLPRVFERFYRVDKARSRQMGGTGLGLAIVKHLARAHGGEAYGASEVGVGSEFAIKLPQRALTASSSDQNQAAAETSSYSVRYRER